MRFIRRNDSTLDGFLEKCGEKLDNLFKRTLPSSYWFFSHGGGSLGFRKNEDVLRMRKPGRMTHLSRSRTKGIISYTSNLEMRVVVP